MNDPHDPRDSHLRIGDADRDHAIRLLGVHFADGRLTVSEYDERCRGAAAAVDRAGIDRLFSDLPALPNEKAGTGMEVYSASEIAEQHRRGANPRAGIMALTAISASVAAIVLGNAFAGVLLALIPVTAVALYVLKIGPSSWYTPSPRQLERARLRRKRLAHRLELEERRAQRKLKQSEITSDALDLAHRVMGRGTRRNR